ncbi:hypothetical protein RND81_06G197400 [Saponaria officinalis]|uniref:DRBM domain-containing protein n=1 Tax=Saponaria officinalis TaxID=3572 RepID=A0AAW1KD98_SAPOF
MFKSKLQEFCQSKSWLLPEYSTTREGYDHCPRFKASVIVNGATYNTPDFSKSSKDAQNLVAKLAFEHLTGSASPSPASLVAATSSSLQKPQPSEAVQATPLNIVNPINRDDKKPKDMSRLYKNQLQIYAQKRNLNLPVYVSERDGPPHAPRFKCKVTLEGKTYECQEYFCTIKDAENAAAKIALTSVSSVGIEEEDPGVFKNLLQELAQKEYCCLPEYNTTSSGPSHSPLFVSTVEIKGESFVGQASKTKKLAEMYAAKVAYSALKERKWIQDSKHVFPVSHVDLTPHCFQSIPPAESPQRTVLAANMGPNVAASGHATFDQGAYQKASESYHAVVQPIGSQNIVQNTGVLKPEELPFSRAPSHSPVHSAQQPSNSGLSEYNTPWAGSNAASVHKKVKVFPREQNMTLPPGAIIAHEDEKWIAVSMDSIHGNA